MDWLEFARNYGLTGAGLIAVVWFMGKYVWPFFVSLYTEQQSERRDERARFIATAEAFLNSLAEERASFQGVILADRIGRVEERELDRVTRIEERERFLSALRDHRDQLSTISRDHQVSLQALTKAQEEFTQVQGELIRALEKK